MSRGPLRGGLRPVLTDSRLTSAARSVYGRTQDRLAPVCPPLAGHLDTRRRDRRLDFGGVRAYGDGVVTRNARERRVTRLWAKELDARGQ